MATVITYGTFDLFHVGHLRLLERAKELAGADGKLIVAVSTDRFNWVEKHKKCTISDEDRMSIVRALKCVDMVISEDNWEQKKIDVAKYNVDIFVMGDDWRGKFDFLKEQCEVVYLPRTEGVSSTDIKARMNDNKLNYQTYNEPIIISIKNRFSGFLKTSVIGRMVYPLFQKCWRSYIIPKRRQRLQKHGPAALERLHRLLVSQGVPYYCDYGTLIGFVRDGGFIKHDDDIDISIPPGAAKPADVLKVFLDSGYGFLHAFKYEDRLLEFTVMDACGLSIDVFFPRKMTKEGWIYGYQPIWDAKNTYPNEKANTVIEYEFVEAAGIKDTKVVGTAARIPSNFDEVLTSEYGPWRIPDAKFNTVTDRIHRALPGFAFKISKDEAISLEK